MPKKSRNLTRHADEQPHLVEVTRNLAEVTAQVERDFNLRPGTLQFREPELSIPLPLEGYSPPAMRANGMDCCGPQQSDYSVAQVTKVNTVTAAVAALFDEVNGLAVAIEDIEGRLGGVLRMNPKNDNAAKPCPVGNTKHAQELLEISERLSALRIKLIDITLRIDL